MTVAELTKKLFGTPDLSASQKSYLRALKAALVPLTPERQQHYQRALEAQLADAARVAKKKGREMSDTNLEKWTALSQRMTRHLFALLTREGMEAPEWAKAKIIEMFGEWLSESPKLRLGEFSRVQRYEAEDYAVVGEFVDAEWGPILKLIKDGSQDSQVSLDAPPQP